MCEGFENPKPTVDGIVFDGDAVLLIKRRNEPFRGFWALPGGFVEVGETVESACAREVLEETGIKVEIKKLSGVYSNPDRDPRCHTISIAFLCEKTGGRLESADDAENARFFPLDEMPPLAFDHKKIIDEGVKQRF